MAHRLDPLLRPRSLAVVGASQKPGSVGQTIMRHLRQGGYGGALFAVNPGYSEIEGAPCVPSLQALPQPVEHVVFAIADERLEAAFDDAVAQGAKAATLITNLVLAEDSEPPLKERIRAKALAAGMAICGGNGNGFYNFNEGLWICGFETRLDHRPGGVALITHSGSVFNALVDAEARLDFNIAVSSGQELVTTAADYLDFALEDPTTTVIGLFIETARDPEGFRAGLEKAARKGIPVVALKVGRTAESARMATSHSGALVGDDGAYQALFDRYGVVRVATLDEMAATLMMFAQPHPVGPGGLVTIHDSGGERALLIDLAEDTGTPFAELSADTLAKVAARLDPGLPAVNPLDAWGTGHDYWGIFTDCLTAMLQDEAAALGAVVCDRGPDGKIFEEYPAFVRAAHAATGKPVLLVSNHQGSGYAEETIALTREGFPVLDSAVHFLKGAKRLFDYRDFQARAPMAPPAAPEATIAKWRARLASGGALGEAEALALFGDFGIPVNPVIPAESRGTALAAAEELGYPLALKTAEGLAHKSDVDGVRLAIADAMALASAYDDMAARLGPRVLLAPMVAGGVEMILGVTNDPDFGPVVMIGSGGIHAELLKDVVFALPPFDAVEAGRLIDRLKLRPLLDGLRGATPCDLDALCEAAAHFSVLAATLSRELNEVDVNPLIVTSTGCVAVDALIVPRQEQADLAKPSLAQGALA